LPHDTKTLLVCQQFVFTIVISGGTRYHCLLLTEGAVTVTSVTSSAFPPSAPLSDFNRIGRIQRKISQEPKIFGGGGKILGTGLIRSGTTTMRSDPRPGHDADEAEVVHAIVELAADSLPQFYEADVACPNIRHRISVHPGLPNLEPEILPNRSSPCSAALAGLRCLTSCLRALEHRISRDRMMWANTYRAAFVVEAPPSASRSTRMISSRQRSSRRTGFFMSLVHGSAMTSHP
jgi:hypothetical protein